MSESSNTYRISCPREQFSKLITMLEIFQNYCTDCDIKKGLFRCKTNDRQGVIEMNLSSILQDNDLSFSVIKSKVNSLKSFELDDNVQMEDKNVYIVSNDSNYEFNDQMTKSIFRKPAPKYLDNKFIEQEEFDTMIKAREENLILSHTFTSYLRKRIANISIGLQSETIECTMTGLECSIRVMSSNKQDSALVCNSISLNKEMNDKKFNMIILPFIIDAMSDIKFSCYLVSNDVCLCKSELVYFGVPIVIYTQAKLLSISE